MKRRELLVGAGAMVAAMTAGKAMAAGMDHSAHAHGADYSSLINAASDCNKTALACHAHCLETFAAGDLTLAQCAKEVSEMTAVCEATIKAASLNAKYLKELVAVCKKAGEACKAECLKHAKKHDVCRKAAEDCDKCIKECDKILG